MHRYYLKKLGSQELGSPKYYPDGTVKISRGRYIYISKDNDGFFPFLSETVLNDKAFIQLSMPFSSELFYAWFGYHNSRQIDTVYTDGLGRNEMRLYLNSQVDDDKRYFHPGEIVVFEKVIVNESTVYVVHIFSQAQQEYALLNSMIPSRKGFALVDDPLDFLSTTRQVSTTTAEINDSVLNLIETSQRDLIEEENMADEEEISLGAGLFNSVTFRDFVMQAYGYKCAVTRRVLRCGDLNNLEAAHIRPRAHNGLYLPCNGIALSRDMHFAFDKGFFTVDDHYKIVVHPNVLQTDSYLNEYNGQELSLPRQDYFKPRIEYLHYHQDNIYGSFRQIRSIDTI